MSVIRIKTPASIDECCSTCLEIQLAHYRNKVKAKWNELNNDGKFSIATLDDFTLNPALLWEPPVTMLGGSLVCLTHIFTLINANAERAATMVSESAKPRIQPAKGSLNQFRKI